MPSTHGSAHGDPLWLVHAGDQVKQKKGYQPYWAVTVKFRKKRTPHAEGRDKVQGCSVDPRFVAGLPFGVPEIQELKSGKKKTHKLLTHTIFEMAVDHETTGLTRRKSLYFLASEEST